MVDHLAAPFQDILSREWTRKKKPYGFDRAYGRVRALPRDDPERIFYDKGFETWLAFFLAQNSSKHHRGQAAECEAVSKVGQLTTELQEKVADKVRETEVHASILGAKNLLLKPPRRGGGSGVVENSSDERRITSPSNQMHLSPTTGLPPLQQIQTSTNTGSHRVAATEASAQSTTLMQDSNQTATTASPRQQTVSDPPSSGLITVFPPYTCGAIRKHGDRAAITMAFPYTFGMVCMSLRILPNKIQHFAKELFGVHVEIENGFRVVILENGVTLVPEQTLIQGAQDGSIDVLLGSDVREGVSASPARKEEIQQASLSTRCVTMIITSDPGEDGILNINIGEPEAYHIKNKLFS